MKLFLPVFCILVIFPTLSFSDAAVSGRSIGVACAGCHGTDGLLSKPGLPRLKSKPVEDIYKALIEFKTEKTRSTIMGRITKGYTDEELRSVAKYFHELP